MGVQGPGGSTAKAMKFSGDAGTAPVNFGREGAKIPMQEIVNAPFSATRTTKSSGKVFSGSSSGSAVTISKG